MKRRGFRLGNIVSIKNMKYLTNVIRSGEILDERLNLLTSLTVKMEKQCNYFIKYTKISLRVAMSNWRHRIARSIIRCCHKQKH